MSAEPARFVLDSYALLAYMGGDAGMPRVKAVLAAAGQGECQVYLSWMNLGEVLYITEREQGLRRAHAVLAQVQILPIEMLEVSSQIVLEADHLKATPLISYTDAFAAASALSQQAILLTGDPELTALEPMMNIEWLERA
jgi:predicted nucleic acid-binding protein